MTDRFLPKRDGRDPTFQSDIERAVGRLRSQVPDISSAYTPGDPTNWVSPAPTTIAEALDRLAAAVSSASTSI